MAEEPGGRELALRALQGQTTAQIPVALFTWTFNYTWKVADLEPWQLACGGSRTWHKAHLALVERHHPDLIFYSGAGEGPEYPMLIEDTDEKWIVQNNNTGVEYEIIKNSLTLRERATGKKSCDPIRGLESREDVDQLVPTFTGWGAVYLEGLKQLIREVGDRALVLPHHSPAYICACYTLGFERAMEMMLTDPDLFLTLCNRHAAGDRLRMRELTDAGAQAVFLADGWASCDVISPAMFETFAWPYQRSITRAAHEAGLKVILWNEGDILPILPKEAELPVDAFAFEQPRKGVELTVEKVRKAFGPDRCLLGNLDSERLLLRGDPEEIAQAVKTQIEQSGPDAPFILSTGSPLPDNVSPQAVDLMMRV